MPKYWEKVATVEIYDLKEPHEHAISMNRHLHHMHAQPRAHTETHNFISFSATLETHNEPF